MNDKISELEQEILKIRQNKILAEYLRNTSQWLRLDPATGEIEFRENRELRPNYNIDKGWGILTRPVIPQHPAQHQNLSVLK